MLLLGDKNPVHLAATTDSARRKLQHIERLNGNSRLAKLNRQMPAQRDRLDRSEERDLADSEDLKYEAAMCYLRGICYTKQNALDRAKECYKCAVRIDVRCYEAFDELMRNTLMTPAEQWTFMESIDFDRVSAPDVIRNLYTIQLSKYSPAEALTNAIETLSSHGKLKDNPDVLRAHAELDFAASRYQRALEITSDILAASPNDFATLPLHLALLHQKKDVRSLFTIAHELADQHPTEPSAWLAIGTYYLTTDRLPEARAAFSKATILDQRYAPAWIGFGHTFAAEGESDQAIAAYSTVARLCQGSHLPQLFLGMQEIAVGNLTVAKEYLSSAYDICEHDPLLLNESGVVAYMEENYNGAIGRFLLAIQIAQENEAPQLQIIAIRANLAQAYRKAARWEEALEEFDEVIRLGSHDSEIFTSKALVLLELDQVLDAIATLHEALAINPNDAVASELMDHGMQLLQTLQAFDTAEQEAVEDSLRSRLRQAR